MVMELKKKQENILIKKCQKILRQLTEDGYEIYLFTLIKTEEHMDKWDIAASFTDNKNDRNKNFIRLIDLIKSNLDKPLIKEINKVNIYNPSDPLVNSITTAIRSEGGVVRLADTRINDFMIYDAYILRSVKPLTIAEQYNQ